MVRGVVPLSCDNVADLPMPCRSCTFWEVSGRAGRRSTKDDWVSQVLLEWGGCGRIVRVDDQLAGFAIYAPAAYVAGGRDIVNASVSRDAVLLTTVRVLPGFEGGGLGRLLVQAVAKDLMGRRKVRAIEAFGDAQGRENGCVVPVGFLTAVGFTTVQDHPRYPRLRLDLRGVLSWRDDVELALERWLGALRPSADRAGTVHPGAVGHTRVSR